MTSGTPVRCRALIGFAASLTRALCRALLACALLVPAVAQAAFTVTPITWNVIGLDSNNPATGPKNFPVGARVCSNVAATNIGVTWSWTSANPNIQLRPGSLGSITIPSLAAGACADAYFEVEVTPVAAAFDTTRRYTIVANDGVSSASSPTPRELYVEHLISQSRNSITDIKLDGVSIPAGGSMNLVVGNTYAIELDGGTATQGYNQFEAFINMPNTIFQILSVATTYSANNSPYVPGPFPLVNDKLYADACLWDANPASPNYRSCVGGDFKSGGSDVRTTYTVRIISGGGTSQTINSLLYDFSGSSYHYNADYGVGARIVNIIDPTTLAFAKAFTPSPAVAGGTSTLTFTITNPNAGAVGGVGFTDPLPLLAGSQMVVATPAVFSTSGCGAPTFAPAAGAASVALSNATVPANGSCVVSVKVFLPAAPTTGTYANTSGNLLVGALDTGKNATANLPLTSVAPPSNTCGLVLAQWTMPPAAGTSVPPAFSTKAGDVATATAASGAGLNDSAISTAIGNPVNAWGAHGWSTSATLSTANNDYFEFAATTTNYNNITFAFDAQRSGTPSGPASLQLYFSTDGTTFTPYGGVLSPGTTFSTFSPAFTGPGNPAGLTYFRIYGYNAANSGTNALLFIDNITIGGCQSPLQPTLTKTFLTNPVAVGGTSTLQFTLTNPNTSALTGAKFTDNLPAGLQVAASPSAATTCGGSPTWAPTAGATALAFGQTTGATLAAGGSCTASVNVTATTAGPHTNVSGFISTVESGTNTGATGSATASLTALLPPAIAKDFSPNPIVVNGTSLLTFVITNPNVSDSLTALAFADTYPAGLTNVNPLSPPVANTCGGSVTAAAGGNGLSLAGGSLAAGASCVISVTITAALAGSYVNTTGNVAAAVAGSGNTDSATLTVTSPNPAIDLLKQIGTSATGPWFSFVAVTPGTPLFYKFTVENVGDVALNPFSVTDPILAGSAADPATCVWQTPNAPSTLPVLPVASATIDPTATCVVGPVSAALGDVVNSATAHGTYTGVVYDSAPARAEYVGAPPGFSLSKSIGISAAGPWSSAINVAAGSSVFYRFLVVNTGAVPLTSINVTDPLVNASGCAFIDPLAVGGATLCVVGPVVASGAAGSTTTNTATAHGTFGVTVFDTVPSSASFTIGAGSADLAVTKSVDNAAPNVGTNVTFTVTVTNNGPSTAFSTSVSDLLPSGYAFVSATPSTGSYVSGTGAWTIGSMGSGASATLSITATVNATGSYNNTATATSTTPDPDPSNNSASAGTTPVPQADLAVTKTVDNATPNVGANVTFTVTVQNNGPSAAASVSVSDALPAGYSLVSATPSVGSYSTGVWAVGALANGASATLSITATVLASGSYTNTATASSTTSDPNPANNSASASTTPTAQADLGVIKTVDNPTPGVGSTVTFTITLNNNGPSAAASVQVADALPAGYSFVSATPSVGSYSAGLWTIGAFANAASATLTISAIVQASGPYGNTATVSSTTPDPNPGNNSSTVTPTVTPTADLAITKTNGVTSVTAGGPVTYNIVASNAGPSGVIGALVSDAFPAALAGATWTCSGTGGGVCPVSGTGNVSALVDLPVAATVTFVVTATVAPSATGTLSNTATITPPAGTTDSNPGNNSATDTDPIQVQVTLAVAKTDGSTTYTPGGNAVYTVTVTNTGPSSATSLNVADALPAGVTLSANAGCVAAGNATCGTVTGLLGQSSFGTTGATLGAAAGDSLTFTAPVAFAPGMTTTPLVNQATATDAATGATAQGSDSNAIAAQVSLSVVKSDGSATYTPGGTATYTVTINNGGVSNALNITVADTLPAGVTLTGTVTCVANGSANCGTVTGTAGQTSFGATGAQIGSGVVNSLVYTVPVAFAAALAVDPLVNTATATDLASGATGSGTDSNTRAAAVTLVVVKTDGSATYTPGGSATYTVTVTNTGVSDALDVVVTDALPTGVTLSANATCVAAGLALCGTVTGTTGQAGFGATGAAIAAGAGNSLTFTVPVSFAASLADNPLVNAATARDNQSGATATGSDSNALAALAGLGVSKTDGSATYTPGGSATYTVVVTNAGPSSALAVTVTDPLPAGVTLTANATCVAAGGATCGTVTGTTGQAAFGTTGATIAAGAGNSLTFTAPVAFAAGLTVDPLVNTVTANDPASTGPVTASDSNARSTQVSLAVVKTDGSATYAPGGTATYTVSVTNGGLTDATNVTIADTLPAGVTLTANVTCVGNGGATCGTITGSAGQSSFGAAGAQIPSGAGHSLVYTVPVAFAAGLLTDPLVNTASATDLATGANASGSDSNTRAALIADLAVTKTNGVSSVTPGSLVTYTIAVSNAGPAAVTGASVADTPPATLSGVTWTCAASAGSSCPAAGSGAIGALVDLLAGGTATFTLSGTLSPAATGTLANTVTVAPPSGVTDPNPGNNSATDSDPITVVAPTADLAITKTNGATAVTPGSAVTYAIVVTNNGPSGVAGATVADTAPASLAGVTWTCTASAGSSCPASGTGSIAASVNLLVGRTVTFTFTGTLSATATGTLANTATVAPPAGTTDPNPANNSATDADPIAALQVDLSIVKQSIGTFYAGQIGAQYAILVSNVGSGASTGTVTVTDVLPAGLTATSISGSGWTCTQPAGPCARGDSLAPGMAYPVLTLVVNVAPTAPSPLTNTVNLAGGGDVNGANNSSQNVVALAPGLLAQEIPVDSPAMLILLASLLALGASWRMRTRRIM